jgi:hypothetical protein
MGMTQRTAADLAQRICNEVTQMALQKDEKGELPTLRPIKEYLLKDTDKLVEAVLAQLKITKEKDLEEKDPAATTWRSQVAQVAKKQKVLVSSIRATEDVKASRWCEMLPLREQKGLHANLANDGKQNDDGTLTPITSIDASQSIPQMVYRCSVCSMLYI